MIDHITFGVADFDCSVAFYDLTLAPLGVTRLHNIPAECPGDIRVAGYGDDHAWFWLAEEKPTNGLFHIAFQANSRAAVDAFYKSAILAGGTDNGQPGLRAHYHQTYYAAFVRDPEGHNIEAVFHGNLS